jgi:hypothetical protein
VTSGSDAEPPPDAATAEDASALVDSGPSAAQLACGARYGSATNYLYCAGAAGWCEFYVALTGVSCQTLCTARGGTCLGVRDNQGGVGTVTCEPLASSATCTSAMNDGLCTCTTETPDAGSADASAASCTALYGASVGFLLCREEATLCEFYSGVHPTDVSCDAVCAAKGGACLAAHDNPDPLGNRTCAYKLVTRTCSDLHADAICTCTR